MVETVHIILVIIHVLLACLLVGMSFFAVMAVWKNKITPRDIDIFQFIKRFGGWFASSQFIVGILLVASEPSKFLYNPLVWVKFILLVLDGYVSVMLAGRRLKMIETGKGQKVLNTFKLAVLASFLIFSLAVILGVIVAENASS